MGELRWCGRISSSCTRRVNLVVFIDVYTSVKHNSHIVSLNSNTAGISSGAGHVYPSKAHTLTPDFLCVQVAQSVFFYGILYVIICYNFHFLSTIALSVLRLHVLISSEIVCIVDIIWWVCGAHMSELCFFSPVFWSIWYYEIVRRCCIVKSYRQFDILELFRQFGIGPIIWYDGIFQQCCILESLMQFGILELFRPLAILESFRQCCILELFRQLGIFELFRQCGILESFRQLGISWCELLELYC